MELHPHALGPPSSDTNFLTGETVDRVILREELARIKAEGGKPATNQPLLGRLIPAGTGLSEYQKIRAYPLDIEEEALETLMDDSPDAVQSA